MTSLFDLVLVLVQMLASFLAMKQIVNFHVNKKYYVMHILYAKVYLLVFP